MLLEGGGAWRGSECQVLLGRIRQLIGLLGLVWKMINGKVPPSLAGSQQEEFN